MTPASWRNPGPALLATAMGAAANALAMGVPGALPLLLGLVVPVRFANRGQPYWAVASGLAVGLATQDAVLLAFCALLAALSVALAGRSLSWRLLWTPLLAVSLSGVLLWLAPPLVPWPLALALLAVNALLAQFASHLLFDVPERNRTRPLPTLRRLLTSSFTVTLTPALFIGLLVVGQSYWSGLAADAVEAARRVNLQIGVYVEEHVGEHLRAVAQAADDASASGGEPSLYGLRQRLEGFLTLLVTDAKGAARSFHAPGATVQPAPVGDRSYFRTPRDTGLPYVSDVFRGRGFGSDALVAVSAPYVDASGRFAGIVEGSLSLEAMQRRLASMADSEGLDAVLRDAGGTVVASTLPGFQVNEQVDAAQFAPAPGGRRLPLSASGDTVLIDAALPSLGWRLTTLAPLAPIARVQTLGHLLLGLACLAGLWLIHWLSARFVRSLSGPLDQLLVHIRMIDLDEPASLRPVALEARFAELAELHGDFNAMLSRLADLDARLRTALRNQAELNRELEQRVTRRTEDLNDALTKARQLAEAKTVFLANMSHELRTPLTSILGYAELAMQPDARPGTLGDSLQTIRRQGEHLLGVVNDVLDAGRIESGELRVEATPVGIAELLADLESTFAARARERGIALRIVIDPDLPGAVIADPLRLRQVLINLLGNAVKFTEQGWVQLRARRCLRALVFSVRDSGIGLDAETRSRLFLPFSQADLSTTRRFGGSGLGLFISRRLCEAMGGRLGVHGRPGRGSRFSLVFPLSLGAKAPATALRELTAEPRVPRLAGEVLVADDVDDLRRLLVAMVEATGARVRACANGLEVLDALAGQPADLVLMDMHMPLMDGQEATRRLRAAGQRMPIVAVTADVLPEDRRRFLAAGCDTVLHKPIRRDELYALLADCLTEVGPPEITGSTGLAARLDSLRQRYLERLAEDAVQLEILFHDGNRVALLESLHKLKGSAGTFGFGAVSAAAARLEAILQQGGDGDTAVAEQELVDLLDLLRSAQPGAANGDQQPSGGTLGA